MAKSNLNTAPVLLDKRVVERNIKKGMLTREEYEKHLVGLADVATQAEKITATLHGDDDDDDDLDDLDDEEDNDDAEG